MEATEETAGNREAGNSSNGSGELDSTAAGSADSSTAEVEVFGKLSHLTQPLLVKRSSVQAHDTTYLQQFTAILQSIILITSHPRSISH